MTEKEVYYAKPDQTYDEHIYSVYNAWRQVTKCKKRLIKQISIKFGFPEEEFIKLSLMTVLLHDIGKLILPFQTIMKAKREQRSISYSKNYRHELCSLPFLLFFKNLLIKDKSLKFPYELFAVAGHHKILDITQRSFEREIYSKKEPSIIIDALDYALELVKDIFKQEGYDIEKINNKLKFDIEGRKVLNKAMANLSQLICRYDGDTIRIIYALTKGILHYADWYGSANLPVIYKIQKQPSDIITGIKERCLRKGLHFTGLREFQIEVGKIHGNAIAIAPTGSGKTEASILWALNNIKDLEDAKLIYLLPTMATANSIWIRFSELFGSENVGLAHSSAHIFFKQEEESADYEDIGEKERNLLFDRTFIRPVTVGTVDQLLNMGYNSRHWTVKEINAMNAVIVIDEIHAYDGWTMGLIMKTIEHLSSYGARFLLMSATMPQYMIDVFKRYLKNVKIVQDTQLLNAKRSKYFVDERNIEEAKEDIIFAVKSGYKVLVVVNTVGLCQQMAKDLKEYNPVCYHSRFIQKDRKEIEKSIEDANFVIATQIVEVSLDIDFDWLFTECAPPDAIAQRAGRVNRYRELDRDSRVFIFKPSEKSEKLYNPLEDPGLLSRTIDAFKKVPRDICEKDLLRIIQEVYSDFRIEDTEAYKHAIEMYKIGQRNRLYILDDPNTKDTDEKTRLERYETISVIPYCFYNDVLELNPADRALYEVKIPYWYFLKHGKIRDGIIFCNLKYDSYYGVILEEDNRTIIL